jgi:hypothetical protein
VVFQEGQELGGGIKFCNTPITKCKWYFPEIADRCGCR